MNRRNVKHWNGVQGAFIILFCILVTNSGLFAEEQEQKLSGLRGLTPQRAVEANGGKYRDLFVTLKKHEDFKRLSERHQLDDPAVWPTLRKRFILKRAELQERLSDAESMASARDRRSGLDNKVVSAEKTRAKGRALRDELMVEIDELQQMLRMMEEFGSLFETIGQESAVTDFIQIENQAGQGFTGQVLLIDGNDLVVQRQNAGYFRVPANVLSDSTKRAVLQDAFSDWEALAEIELRPDHDDAYEILAYDESHLYLRGNEGFVVAHPRSEDGSFILAYVDQLESAREALSEAGSREEKDELEAQIGALEAALLKNQSRLETIEWHESRLEMDLPSEQKFETEPDAGEVASEGQGATSAEAADETVSEAESAAE